MPSAPPAGVTAAGTPFTLTVSTTSDSASTTALRVSVRPDDGRPCEASAAAVHAALPKAVEVLDEHRPATPVTVDVPAQSFVGGLRVCAFVELVPAPQTTLSAQELVVPIRAPRGTIQLQVETASPFFGQSFAVRAQGSTEAADGNVLMRAQRGPWTPLSAAELDDLGGIRGLAAGTYDRSWDVTIDPAVRVVPDRVCAWLLRGRIVRGGSCVALKAQRKGINFDFECRLKRPPRRPFVVQVTHSTGLGIERSAGRVTIAVPKQRSRRRR